MAVSKCTGCGGGKFELVLKEPKGSQMQINFVQCASCGVVVGTMDYFALGNVMDAVNAVSKQIKDMDHRVGHIDTMLRRLAK
jgi:uncharacterized Zn finger protein